MSEIRRDQKVEILFKDSNKEEVVLECSVRELYPDRLYLSSPVDVFSYGEFLKEGDEICVKIYTPTGIKMFNAIILDSPLGPDFIIEFAPNCTEIQRRRYLRANLKTKIIVQRNKRDPINTYTLDIGGGGVRFFYEGVFNNNEPVTAFIYLPKQIHSVQVRGIILKREYLAPNEYILVFTEIMETGVSRITKKCIELTAGDAFEEGNE